MSRQPPRDLPAIPEVSTPHEIDDIDDNASKGSYAFTLDGVGFDEESGSILHTPPSLLVSPDRLTRRDEAELHKQTCRSLGIPYSGEMHMGSPRDSVESTSTASLAKNNVDNMYDVPLEGLVKQKESSTYNHNEVALSPLRGNGSGTFKNPRLITRAKLAEITSTYTNSMKELAVSISNKSKRFYANSKQKFLTQDGGRTDSSDVKKTLSFDPNEWYPRWIRDANPLMKLTASMAFLFLMLFVVVIVAVSKSNDHAGRVERSSSNVIDVGTLSSVLNVTGSDSTDKLSGTQASATSMPSYLPTFSPTISPSGIDEPNSCIDSPGTFKTSRGKSRMCSWLTSKHLERECGGGAKGPSELGSNCKYTCKEYNDCDKSTETPTKMPTTTKPTRIPTNKPTKRRRKNKTPNPTHEPSSISVIQQDITEEANNEENETIYFTDTNSKLRPCTWLDIRNPTQRTKRREDNCVKVTVQMLCPRSCADYAIPINTRTKEAAAVSVSPNVRSFDLVPQDECYDQSGYFLNEQNHPVKCSWLVDNTLDEAELSLRRQRNCGGSLTDLGKMCKTSCGTC
ncbi:hypothetical protein HJC23_011936 [Cyclotella cryptica]|uniref:ShKT domain-containing protein n=1 Tax=Cyclotella cryptica TaxID=29204 RepID=A0ABD3QR75_9STRA|eukprot:CCRYP_002983-RA/>CCRYP_002983-RA protein AED:0.04 eAED:0.04 QI:0/-1/0/1/-1/1/1/0/567